MRKSALLPFARSVPLNNPGGLRIPGSCNRVNFPIRQRRYYWLAASGFERNEGTCGEIRPSSPIEGNRPIGAIRSSERIVKFRRRWTRIRSAKTNDPPRT